MLVSQGQSLADAIRQIGVSEVTYYRWHGRLRRVVSDLTLDKLILTEAAKGNF